MQDLIVKNYAVLKFFDNVPDGYASKRYLSKEEAGSICDKLSKKPAHYNSYQVVEHVSMLAVVPFNSGFAYVFNKLPETSGKEDLIKVIAATYEELMQCYVFRSLEVSNKDLEELKAVYFERGGAVYNKYHSFETLVLRPVRNARNELFKIEIIEAIIGHGFTEVKTDTWINAEEKVKITIGHSKMAIGYPTLTSHLSLPDYGQKLLIGSIFYKHLKEVNQLSKNRFSIRCHGAERYLFVCFEVDFSPVKKSN